MAEGWTDFPTGPQNTALWGARDQHEHFLRSRAQFSTCRPHWFLTADSLNKQLLFILALQTPRREASRAMAQGHSHPTFREEGTGHHLILAGPALDHHVCAWF